MTWWEGLLTGVGGGLLPSLVNQYLHLRYVWRELERHEQDIINNISAHTGVPRHHVQAMRDLARTMRL